MSEKKKWAELLEEKIQPGFPKPWRNEKADKEFADFVQNCIAEFETYKNLRETKAVREATWYYGDLTKRRLIPQSGKTPKEVIDEVKKGVVLPQEILDKDTVIKELLTYFNGMPVWGAPKTMINVIPPSPMVSIAASLLAAIVNANIIDSEYSSNIAAAELETISMIAQLIGWDPVKAGGVFTFGGTGNYMYGTKVALTKFLGKRSRYIGIREDVRVLVSKLGHYVKKNCTDWTGLGMRNIVEIEVDDDNSMDIVDLERVMRKCYEQDIPIAMIIATTGTTDACGIDDVKKISDLCNSLTDEYSIEKRPYVYADAVIGWPWLFFKDYDFKENPLEFSDITNEALRSCTETIKTLYYADAVGIDFHKTGISSYICSLFCVKNNDDFDLLRRPASEMAYLYHNSVYSPGEYTLETSRTGAYSLVAWANLKFFGVEGYRVMIGHLVELGQAIRKALESCRNLVVVNPDDYGTVTLFRAYPTSMNAIEQYENELYNAKYMKDLELYNKFQTEVMKELIYLQDNEDGPALSITTNFRSSVYGKPVTALKSYPMDPLTTTNVEQLKGEIVSYITRAVQYVENKMET